MKLKESAFVRSREARGSLLGAGGVLAFSGTLIATRVADPAFGSLTVGTGRAVVASLLAVVVLRRRRLPLRPSVGWTTVLFPGLGVVLGFPLLSAVALTRVPAAHAAVAVGLAPVATAGFAVLLAGERPSPRYWAALALGTVAALGFAAVEGGGRPQMADLLILGAVVSAGYGYARGAVLAREHDGGTVICWALIATLPLTLPLTAAGLALHPPRHVGPGAAAGLAYASVISMLLGFFAWYRGLALGGVARVGQLQVIQPVLTMGWAVLLLGESLSGSEVVAAALVIAAAAVGRRQANRGAPPAPVPSASASASASPSTT
jgi:drug/metabolite transporter (DMT)-like permease